MMFLTCRKLEAPFFFKDNLAVNCVAAKDFQVSKKPCREEGGTYLTWHYSATILQAHRDARPGQVQQPSK
jgi:hypothetical protein